MLTERRIMNDSNRQIYEQVWEISKDKHIEWMVPFVTKVVSSQVGHGVWNTTAQNFSFSHHAGILTMICRHHMISFHDEKTFV